MLTERLDVLKCDYGFATDRAAEILKSGGIVAIPTETVYGLAASAFSDAAIGNVFTAKGRPQDNPLIVHISDMDMLSLVAADIPEKAYVLAQRFWPGPFTMVLKRTDAVCQSVSAGLDTVAVRCPADRIAQDIIKKSGIPLAAPSANLSGSPSTTTAAHVIKDLDGKIDAVVMGHDCTVGVESTVVTLCTNPPRLLRPGAVTAEQLREILPDLVIDSAVLSKPAEGAKVSSPGMKYKHYSPKTETYLVEAYSRDFVNFLNSEPDCAALCFSEEYKDIKTHKIIYGSYADESALAKNLFSVLRQADELNVNKLYVHAPAKTGVGLAVYNRLIRAAGFKVIKL